MLGSEHPDVASYLNNLAWLYSNQGKYQEAEPLFKRALEIKEKVLGSEHPDVAKSLNNLAGLYSNQSEYLKAKPLYIKAIHIAEKTLGPNHPNVLKYLENCANLLRMMNKNREAIKMEARAKKIRAKLNPKKDKKRRRKS